MAWSYLGTQVMVYQAYLDDATGSMLTAEPGGTYSMTAVDSGPVPPTDGRWEEAQPDPPAPVPPPVPVPVTQPETTPEGGA